MKNKTCDFNIGDYIYCRKLNQYSYIKAIDYVPTDSEPRIWADWRFGDTISTCWGYPENFRHAEQVFKMESYILKIFTYDKA